MPWTTKFLTEDNIILTSSEGVLDANAMMQMALDAHYAAVEHHSQYLLDDHRLMEPSFNMFQLYHFTREIARKVLGTHYHIAIVMPPSGASKREFSFLEITGRNAGFHVKLFLDYDEAREWLLSNK